MQGGHTMSSRWKSEGLKCSVCMCVYREPEREVREEYFHSLNHYHVLWLWFVELYSTLQEGLYAVLEQLVLGLHSCRLTLLSRHAGLALLVVGEKSFFGHSTRVPGQKSPRESVKNEFSRRRNPEIYFWCSGWRIPKICLLDLNLWHLD